MVTYINQYFSYDILILHLLFIIDHVDRWTFDNLIYMHILTQISNQYSFIIDVHVMYNIINLNAMHSFFPSEKNLLFLLWMWDTDKMLIMPDWMMCQCL